MSDEELEKWSMVQYRMGNEGMEYCFNHYSSFEEIKDEQFHKLRLDLIRIMSEMKQYVKDKIDEYEDE